MSRGVLRGGRRRRRAGRLAVLASLLAIGAVGAAAAVALRDDSDDAPPAAGQLVGPAPRPLGPPPGAAAPAEAPAPQVRLSGVDAFRMRFHRPPRAGLLFDLDTGEVLWRRNPEKVLSVASLTKIMTALLVAERTLPTARVRITKAALNYAGSGLGVLKRRQRIRVETLLNGLMIVSGNDAAIALAVHVAGSERRFVRLMNRRARALGLRCTRFVSSHGLQRGNRSCAADLAALATVAMRQPRVARVARRRRARFRFPVKGGKLEMYTHNPLLRAGYRGTLGLKTGFTNAAGRCFVGIARRRGRTLGVVLLHSPDPPKQAPKLLNAGFRAY
jgi:D-alanyl-D-alanine carboxypeptidase